MNSIGIYYAYWAQNWDVDFHPYIDKVADLGFDVLEINAGTVAELPSDERRGLKSHAEDRGLQLTYCVGLSSDCDPAAEDRTIRENGIRLLQRMAEGIGEMGGGVLGGILYGSWPASPPAGLVDKRPYLERSLASMREALRAAEDNRVTFCLEIVNRFEQFLMNTVAEGVDYVEALDSAHAKLLLDTFHLNIEEPSVPGAIETAGRHLGHLHIGENQRMPPGYGHIPWRELGAALRRQGYGGHVVMEPFLQPGGEVGRDIRVHRDLSQGFDLDEEAAKALAFMREVLASA